ncbi:MAG: SMI1/KNR4 family protein [Clostridia bacterium]|nr:SMI1/KNR4 family protein [Clostridia bacterium]
MGLFFRRNKHKADETVQSQKTASLEADEIASSTHEALDADLDLSDFWHDTEESLKRHVCPPLTARMIEEVEKELEHILPLSYIQLMRKHNGGLVNRCRYRVPHPKSGCPDTVYITDIMGIGRDVPYSLCGSFGSRFLVETRRHNPDIGLALCNTTLPGRALVFLDYRTCDELGEPSITWADAQEHMELPLAKNFKEFIQGLEMNIVER